MNFNTASDALKDLKGGTFVGMDTLTTVKLKGGKKNPMQGRVTKQMLGAQVMCFSNTNTNAYEAMVKRRLESEGKAASDFVLGERAWGTRMPGTAFVEHNGKHYLEAIFMRAGAVQYMLDGQPIAVSEIEGMDEPDVNQNGQGGLENRVVIRTFTLENITALRCNGKEWV